MLLGERELLLDVRRAENDVSPGTPTPLQSRPIPRSSGLTDWTQEGTERGSGVGVGGPERKNWGRGECD